MKLPLCLRNRALAPPLVGVVAVAACVLQTLVWGEPVPAVHDEFSYLLAADTFAHGRCANPPHPLWQHFESMHILQQPTYASKYPPGQGLFLAAGLAATGHAVGGVWLGMGLACGAITWMLQARVPAGWALVGGLLAASQLGSGEWGAGYWGGGVAAAGGALFVGGWLRVLRRSRWPASVLMATGLVLLGISRPFEGLLLCLPIGLATFVWLIRERLARGIFVRQVLVPALAVLVPSALALGHYNTRATGSPFRLPYLVHAEQYAVAPVLIVQSPRPEPDYRHEAIREFYAGSEYATYQLEHSQEGWSRCVKAKLQLWWETYFGEGMVLSMLALPCVLLLSPVTRFALVSCAFVLGFVATLETWGFSHYVAPVTCLILLVIVQGFRCVSLVHPFGWPVGQVFVAVWLARCLLLPVAGMYSDSHQPTRPWALARAAAERRWLTGGGRHLVLVRYGEGHSVHEEWVYNGADIDAAPVVWAREMGAEGRARLLDYFKDRTVWLMEQDGHGPRWTRLRDPAEDPGVMTNGHSSSQ